MEFSYNETDDEYPLGEESRPMYDAYPLDDKGGAAIGIEGEDPVNVRMASEQVLAYWRNLTPEEAAYQAARIDAARERIWGVAPDGQ